MAVGAAVWVILVSSIRQRFVPGALLGRVYSASRFISWALVLSARYWQALLLKWGIRTMFGIGGIVSIGLLLMFLLLISPRMLDSQEKT